MNVPSLCVFRPLSPSLSKAPISSIETQLAALLERVSMLNLHFPSLFILTVPVSPSLSLSFPGIEKFLKRDHATKLGPLKQSDTTAHRRGRKTKTIVIAAARTDATHLNSDQALKGCTDSLERLNCQHQHSTCQVKTGEKLTSGQ